MLLGSRSIETPVRRYSGIALARSGQIGASAHHLRIAIKLWHSDCVGQRRFNVQGGVRRAGGVRAERGIQATLPANLRRMISATRTFLGCVVVYRMNNPNCCGRQLSIEVSNGI